MGEHFPRRRIPWRDFQDAIFVFGEGEWIDVLRRYIHVLLPDEVAPTEDELTEALRKGALWIRRSIESGLLECFQRPDPPSSIVPVLPEYAHDLDLIFGERNSSKSGFHLEFGNQGYFFWYPSARYVGPMPLSTAVLAFANDDDLFEKAAVYGSVSRIRPGVLAAWEGGQFGSWEKPSNDTGLLMEKKSPGWHLQILKRCVAAWAQLRKDLIAELSAGRLIGSGREHGKVDAAPVTLSPNAWAGGEVSWANGFLRFDGKIFDGLRVREPLAGESAFATVAEHPPAGSTKKSATKSPKSGGAPEKFNKEAIKAEYKKIKSDPNCWFDNNGKPISPEQATIFWALDRTNASIVRLDGDRNGRSPGKQTVRNAIAEAKDEQISSPKTQ